MTSKQILVVFGATGNQGGSVIKYVLEDPSLASKWHIKGITRDPSKPNAKALEKKGVECITASADDEESLKVAFKGAHTIFGVTNYWEHMDETREFQQGKKIADAAKEVGVSHLIFSTLMDVNKLSGGKYKKVYHFDSKANIEEYIRSIGIPATYFQPGFYMSNIQTMLVAGPEPPHTYTFYMPAPAGSVVPIFDANDTGMWVKQIIKHRDSLLGKVVRAATKYCSIQELVDEFVRAKPKDGKGARVQEISAETYTGFLAKAQMPPKAQEEMLENMQFMGEFGYYGKQSLDDSLKILEDKPTTWEEFMKKDPHWAKLE